MSEWCPVCSNPDLTGKSVELGITVVDGAIAVVEDTNEVADLVLSSMGSEKHCNEGFQIHTLAKDIAIYSTDHDKWSMNGFASLETHRICTRLGNTALAERVPARSGPPAPPSLPCTIPPRTQSFPACSSSARTGRRCLSSRPRRRVFRSARNRLPGEAPVETMSLTWRWS